MIKLYDFQRKSVDIMKERKRLGVWSECGTGKTIVALTAIKELGVKALVVCPLAVVYQWLDEGRAIGLRMIRVMEGQDLDIEADVYVVNYDRLDRITIFHDFKCVVFDESTKLKDVRTKRFKLAKKLFKNTEYIYLLSGTPITNSYLDGYSQLIFLDPKMWSSYYAWRNTYFYKEHELSFRWLPRPGTREMIKDMLKKYGIRYTLSDVGKEVSEVHTIITYDMNEVKNVYRNIVQDYYAKLDENREAMARNAGIVVNKLMQLVSGFIYDTERKGYVITHEKIDILEDILEMLRGRKIVIFYRFVEEARMIMDKSKYSNEMIQYTALQDIETFRKEKQILLAQYTSVGYGVNLQVADTVIFYSIPYSVEQYEQAKDRIKRIGGADKILVYYFLTNDLIDRKVYKVLMDRKVEQENIATYLLVNKEV